MNKLFCGWMLFLALLPWSSDAMVAAPEQGETPLMLLCLSGSAAQIAELAKSSDVNGQTEVYYRVALDYALKNPRPFEAVSVLLAYGAKPGSAPQFLSAAIARLQENRDDPVLSAELEKTILLWLEQPVKHNVDDVLLSLVVFWDDPALFVRLRELGARVARRIPSPLGRALWVDNLAAAEWLLQNGADPGWRDEEDRPALALAHSNAGLELLWRYGAEPDQTQPSPPLLDAWSAWISPENLRRSGQCGISEAGMIEAGANPQLPVIFETLVNIYGRKPPVVEMMKQAVAGNQRENIRFLKAAVSKIDWSEVNFFAIVRRSPCYGQADDRIAILKFLLAQGLPINTVEEHSGRTPLMLACRAFPFDPADVEFLLRAGASADAVDAAGFNALFHLLSSNNGDGVSETLELLLRYGTPLRQRNSGFNLLMTALASEQPPAVIARLVELGENVNFKTRDGVTPLMLAALLYRAEVAELLLRHGAEINACDTTGWSPLFYASYYFPESHGGCSLSYQPRNRSKVDAAATVQLLLAHGADAGLADDFGASALTEAAAWCDAETMRQLIRAGGGKAVDARNRHHRNAILTAACSNPDSAAVEELLKAGADPNSRMRDGKYPVRRMQLGGGWFWKFQPETFGVAAAESFAVLIEPPLFEAARQDRVALARLLLQYGAEVNRRYSHSGEDREGDTLFRRRWDFSVEMEAVLLEAGLVDPALPDKPLLPEGKAKSERESLWRLCGNGSRSELAAVSSPPEGWHAYLLEAVRKNSLEAVRLLVEEKGAAVYDELGVASAANRRHPEVMRYLLRRNPSILQYRSRSDEERTMLFAAATAEIMDILLEEGVDIDAVDGAGDTPLMWQLGKWGAGLAAAELLLERGAEVKNVNKAGETALTRLFFRENYAIGSGDVYRRLFLELVQRGADVNMKYNDQVLLDYALVRNWPEKFEILVEAGADITLISCDLNQVSPYLRRRMAELQ